MHTLVVITILTVPEVIFMAEGEIPIQVLENNNRGCINAVLWLQVPPVF